MQTTVAILAGGKSRRMGADKALLEVDGVPLLERTARVVVAEGFCTFIVGRSCPQGWPLSEVAFIADATPEQGPSGGLATALRIVSGPVLALACDMPRLTGAALHWLETQAAALAEQDGLAVRNQGQWEPLFGFYTPDCLPLLESRLAAGRLSLQGLLDEGQFGRVEAPAGIGAQLVNVNTPEDFAAIAPLRS